MAGLCRESKKTELRMTIIGIAFYTPIPRVNRRFATQRA
jgi:hypothetical protein